MPSTSPLPPLLVVSRYCHWRWTLLLESVCRRIRDEGIPVLQVGECAPHEANAGELFIREPGIRRINLPLRVNWRRSPCGYVLAYRRFQEQLARLIDEHAPRAVIFENPELAPVMVGVAKRFPGLPLVYWATELSYRPLHFPFRVAERSLAPRLSGLVMNHPGRIDVWKRRVQYDVPAMCIPNTLDALPDPAVFEKAPLREKFRTINPHINVIMVYQGVISEKQAILETLEALAMVPDNIGFAFGRTVGNKRYIREVEAAVRRLGLERRVVDPGWIPLDDLAEMTASADFGLVLIKVRNDNTRYYASSKMYNYFQSGHPVVGSAIPALKDIIKGNRLGLTVEQNSPEQIAEAIRTMADPDTRAALRKNVQTAFRERLSLDACWKESRPTLMGWIKGTPA